MKMFHEFVHNDKDGNIDLRIVLTPENGPEKVLLRMGLHECPQVRESPHDPDSIEMNIWLNRHD